MYDQVHRPERGDSDSGPISRASSASPPVCDSSIPDDAYSEVTDTDHLIKPSQLVKNRRSMYAGESSLLLIVMLIFIDIF